MISCAFRYLLPAPGQVSVQTLTKSKPKFSTFSTRPRENKTIPLAYCLSYSLAPGHEFLPTRFPDERIELLKACSPDIGLPSASVIHSSSLESSSSSSATFLAGFFFFFLFLPFAPVDLATGCSRIRRTSSSVIFFSDLYCSKSGGGGALRRTIPFFVMAKIISLSHVR